MKSALYTLTRNGPGVLVLRGICQEWQDGEQPGDWGNSKKPCWLPALDGGSEERMEIRHLKAAVCPSSPVRSSFLDWEGDLENEK